MTLVGAGPGDPELLTVKAVKALRRATVALEDDLVDPGVLRYLRRSARIVHVGKRGGCASTPQAFIHRLMVTAASRGEHVVRLKGGDPFVFGRGAEECDALREAGIAVDVIGGLTAGIAGPAAMGVSSMPASVAALSVAGMEPQTPVVVGDMVTASPLWSQQEARKAAAAVMSARGRSLRRFVLE